VTTAAALALSVAAVAVAAAAMIPRLPCCRRAGAVPPRLLAALHMVSLAGLPLLPAAGAVCAGLGLALPSPRAAAAAAHCGSGPGAGLWLPAGLSLAALAPLAWQAARVLPAARRAELAGMALAAARPRRLPGGGLVWVLPSPDPAAYACGLRRPRAVVTTGLLDLLDPAEQRAACEHEYAHVRLGHPRLLLLGAVVARAYGFLPPVRHAWSGLRRELEAAADDEAVRAVGAGPVLSALARAALARSAAPGMAAAFGDPQHLRYRIARLREPRPASRGASALAAAGGLALVSAFTWSACGLAAGAVTAAGFAVCAAALAAAALRPVWPAAPRAMP
jgi:Zn-dependent protease with chaperone function